MSNTEKATFQIPTQQELEQLSELHKAMGDYSRMNPVDFDGPGIMRQRSGKANEHHGIGCFPSAPGASYHKTGSVA